MPRVRAGGAKWKSRTAAASQDYASGVAGVSNWASRTAESEAAYQAGVQDAISRGAYGRGVQKTGDAGYKQAVASKGVSRFSEGVNKSGDAYDRGFAPYRQVIEATNLPPRGRRGDPANFERSRVMGQALHDARRSQSGG